MIWKLASYDLSDLDECKKITSREALHLCDWMEQWAEPGQWLEELWDVFLTDRKLSSYTSGTTEIRFQTRVS